MTDHRYAPDRLVTRDQPPLPVAAQGFFWVGGEYLETAEGPQLAGQMYVEYRIPEQRRSRFPIVLVHGGGGQGLDFLGTADGREGWAQWFVRQGYPVYVVDRPGHGRSPFHPDVQGPMSSLLPLGFLERFFTRPSSFADAWPQASLHRQWPGRGDLDDPAFMRFAASAGPAIADMERSDALAQRAGAALLDAIGPAVVLTHSAGGPMGWLVADARPDLVRAIVAVEPIGPPFATRSFGTLKWGITAGPLQFDPPANEPGDLATCERPSGRADRVSCLLQAEPARRLPNLTGFPIVVVTAEASWMAADNHGIVDFLAQAGADVEHLRLEDHGVRGNGHAMMLEANSDAVAEVIDQWISRRVG